MWRSQDWYRHEVESQQIEGRSCKETVLAFFLVFVRILVKKLVSVALFEFVHFEILKMVVARLIVFVAGLVHNCDAHSPTTVFLEIFKDCQFAGFAFFLEDRLPLDRGVISAVIRGEYLFFSEFYILQSINAILQRFNLLLETLNIVILVLLQNKDFSLELLCNRFQQVLEVSSWGHCLQAYLVHQVYQIFYFLIKQLKDCEIYWLFVRILDQLESGCKLPLQLIELVESLRGVMNKARQIDHANCWQLSKRIMIILRAHKQLLKKIMAKFRTFDKFDIPGEEHKVLAHWSNINAFHQQNRRNQGNPTYNFYDGPPFATGLPHYGHICAGTIKDVVCRYAAQNGFYVQRRFGWDCHGLPIENLVDKQLGIKDRRQILQLGVDKYNQKCRGIVMKYSKEWKDIVTRFGRWIDFQNDYKTMNLSFMESVWHVFKTMYDKGYVYRGKKIMPYSNACNTVLSNFQLALNYKDTIDPSVHVLFRRIQKPDEYLVAWTTTPWTLPSNLALAVNPQFVYVRLQDLETNRILILGQSRINQIYKKPGSYKVVQKFKGKEMIGWTYEPLFQYFIGRKEHGCFKVLDADYVTAETGTCIVHQAPGFGAQDYKTCLKHGLITPDNPPVPLDENGNFTSQVKDFAGRYIKDCDKDIKKYLKQKGLLLKEGTYNHNYPFCWRSDTPLIYKAVTAWFIKVTDMRQQLVKNNLKTHWVPKVIQQGKFNNWLEAAEDWCFSRSRFWGNPVPLWVSDDGEQIVCVGSVKELQDLTGVKGITDIHKQFVDKLTIPSKQGKGVLKRIDQVFDCWFESGSMPFAQCHYPFSISQEQFSKRFPADFVGQGIDQTRGWFYTLNVISTAVKGSQPYKNLIVNGLVMNQEGKKMSKKDKNYPDPLLVCEEHGADAVRLYMINSPVVKAENLDFSKDGVKGVVKDVFLPWINSVKFLVQNLKKWEDGTRNFKFNYEAYKLNKSNQILDKWIVSALHDLILFFRNEMSAYRLYTVVPKLIKFLDKLTNGYVRINRPILRGDNGEQPMIQSLNNLFGVLLEINILMAPFVPFITESLYQLLREGIEKGSSIFAESVHFLRIPQGNKQYIDQKLQLRVAKLISIIEVARFLREQSKVNLKHPVQSLKIVTESDQQFQSMSQFTQFFQEEINIDKVLHQKNVQKYSIFQSTPNHKELGKKLKKAYNKEFIQTVNKLPQEKIAQLFAKGQIDVLGHSLNSTTDILIKKKLNKQKIQSHQAIGETLGCAILLDLRQNQTQKAKGQARQIINRIQRLKKKAKVIPQDDILIFVELGPELEKSYQSQKHYIQTVVKKPVLPMQFLKFTVTLQQSKELYQQKEKLHVAIATNAVFPDQKNLREDFPKYSEQIVKILSSMRLKYCRELVKQHKISLSVNSQPLLLQQGRHFYLGGAAFKQQLKV